MSAVLVIDDNQTMREGMVEVIKKMGHLVYAAESGQKGVEIFHRKSIDFVITDLRMEKMDGIQVLQKLKQEDENLLLMVVTAFGSIETAVNAMKMGACDFITKPFSPDILRLKVKSACELLAARNKNQVLQEENRLLKEELHLKYDFGQLVGRSKSMQDVFKKVKKVAAADSNVIITGQSGTGKELIARAIHHYSPRKDGPFIKVHCGALSENLLESELFGHEKGAFTGAIRRKLGRFELADQGTIFLDEIGDISQVIQVKLLQVLQEKSFERVGGEETIKVNTRIICATNKDLEEEVKNGNFRQDLFYRLHILPIKMAPLYQRREDIPPLVEHFIKKLQKRTRSKVKEVSPEAVKLLKQYNWPGNVRELENVVEQALVLSENQVIQADDLPSHLQISTTGQMADFMAEDLPLVQLLEKVERDMIEKAYQKARGVKTEAARLLGVKTSALYYKLEKYGICPSDNQSDEPE